MRQRAPGDFGDDDDEEEDALEVDAGGQSSKVAHVQVDHVYSHWFVVA